METPKRIPGYPDYAILRDGTIISYRVSPKGRTRTSVKGPDGYWRTKLCEAPSVHRTVYVHRLVALTHVPNPDGKPDVNHKDHNKDNNHADNLEWVTHKENHEKARKHLGNWSKGVYLGKQLLAKPVSGGPETRWLNARLAAISLGHPNKAGNISKAVKTGKAAYGFYWQFADPEAAKRRWEARIRSAAEEGSAHGVARLQALEALAAEAQERGEYSVPAPEFVGTAKDFAGFRNLSKLPPGVMKGSDLEGRG